MSAHPSYRLALFAAVAVAGLSALASAQTQPARKAAPKSASNSALPVARPKQKTADREVRPAAGTERETGKEKRPAPQQLQMKPLPKELKQLLIDWERESAKIKTLVGEHERIVYNSVFETEKWADGKFFYESPDKGRIDLEGREPKEGDKSKRFNEKSGEPYRLEADQQTRWICTGEEIVNINDSEKQFEMFPLPQELRGENIIHGPLPFLFGMKADEAERRFELEFVDLNDPARNGKNKKNAIWLIAKPRQGADKENFQQATIILDCKRFLPYAVKLLDPSGNLETVYTFKELHVNQRNLIPPIFRNDPFHPTLRGYKLMQQPLATPKDEEAGARNSVPPGAGKSNVRQASGATSRPSNGPATQPPRSKTANAGEAKLPAPRTKNK